MRPATGQDRPADDPLTVLVRDRGSALVGYAYLLTGDVSAAEDLAQEAVVRVFVRSRRHRWPDAPESYVRRAILSLYVDGYRRSRRWRDVEHLVAVPPHGDGPADAADTSADVRDALRALAPQERACVVLRYYDDLTVPRIAEHLGLSVGTVKRYLHNAVGKLETLLGPLDDTADDDTDDQVGLVTPHAPTTPRRADA